MSVSLILGTNRHLVVQVRRWRGATVDVYATDHLLMEASTTICSMTRGES